MAENTKIRKIISAHRVLRAKELSALGIARKHLPGLVANGDLIQLSRGLYASPKFTQDARFSWAQASVLLPKGVLCLLSALRFHGLTTQLPSEIWMALPRGAWHPTSTPLELRMIAVSKEYWKLEVETHFIAKVPIRVYSAAKTVVDCFKFRNKVGTDVALEALRDFLRKNRGGSNQIWRLAEAARIRKVIQPYLDATL